MSILINELKADLQDVAASTKNAYQMEIISIQSLQNTRQTTTKQQLSAPRDYFFVSGYRTEGNYLF